MQKADKYKQNPVRGEEFQLYADFTRFRDFYRQKAEQAGAAKKAQKAAEKAGDRSAAQQHGEVRRRETDCFAEGFRYAKEGDSTDFLVDLIEEHGLDDVCAVSNLRLPVPSPLSKYTLQMILWLAKDSIMCNSNQTPTLVYRDPRDNPGNPALRRHVGRCFAQVADERHFCHDHQEQEQPDCSEDADEYESQEEREEGGRQKMIMDHLIFKSEKTFNVLVVVGQLPPHEPH